MNQETETRDVESLIEELHDLNELILHTQQTLGKFPGDSLLSLALKQDEHRKKRLLKELHESLSHYLAHP